MNINKPLLHRFRKYILIMSVLIITILTGCNSKDSNSALLKTACSNMVEYILCHDAITCNYNVMKPENYISGPAPTTLGSYYSVSSSGNAFWENELALMDSVSYKDLSGEDKLTYNALYQYLKLAMKTVKYPYYDEPLSPVSGIQVELPILLAEYHLYNPSYIETYFNVIKSVPDYIADILDYENEKIKNKTFMSGEQVDVIIKQCKDFIADADTNYLIDSFDTRLSELTSLTPDDISRYSSLNKQLITQYIIPAYQSIIDFLWSNRNISDTPTGLCGYGKAGKAYYKLLFRQITNCSYKPDKAYEILNDTLSECKTAISDIISKSDNPAELSGLSLPIKASVSPGQLVASLKQSIAQTYPALSKDNTLQLKAVHPSLEKSLSPAMYLTPPIDAESSDCIYINNSSCQPNDLYTTLAHEAYPGHLYQTRYYMSCSPPAVRLLLNFSGWIEGWATYAELDSLNLIGTDVAGILKYNKLATLCIYSITDIGVHYMGWDIMDTIRFLKENGINDTSASKEIYMSVISEPVLYPKYTMGCIEFMKLKNAEMKKEGSSFNPLIFHKKILETGPIWFDVLWDIFDKE